MEKPETVKKQSWEEPKDLESFGTRIPSGVRERLDDTVEILAARGIPKMGLITRIVSRGIMLACAEFLKHANDAGYIKKKVSE